MNNRVKKQWKMMNKRGTNNEKCWKREKPTMKNDETEGEKTMKHDEK